MSIEQGGVREVRFTLSISNNGEEDAIDLFLDVTHSRSGVYSERLNVTGGNVNLPYLLTSVCMYVSLCTVLYSRMSSSAAPLVVFVNLHLWKKGSVRLHCIYMYI